MSAVADWMSAILAHNHGVALVRIYDAGLKRAARGSLKYWTQKNRHLGAIAQHCRAINK